MLEIIQKTSTDFANNECPGCGLKREQWTGSAGQGYSKEGLSYCCQGCADKRQCLCLSDSFRIVEEISHKPGVQIVESGRIHAERRRHQTDWNDQEERRSPLPGSSSLS